jgi:hypothetical protein
LGYGRHDYGRVHFYLALATVALVLVHVCLHWSWVCATCCNLLGLKGVSPERQEKCGMVLLLALMITIILLLYLAKSQAQ